MRAWCVAAGAVFWGCVAAYADDGSALRALVTADDSRGWEAVGRLDIGRQGFCTGALIAENVVLTAAHCLFNPKSKRRVPDDRISFHAGFRNGRATATRGIARSVVHPEYRYLGSESGEHVATDIALVELSRPIRNTSVSPFPTGRWPRKGATVQVVSYAHNRATRPAIQEACYILGRPGGSLVMSCDVDFGSSGAPVFVDTEDGPVIVSVISAKADVGGRRVSLGTGLEGDLLGLMTRLEEVPTRSLSKPSAPVVLRAETNQSAATRRGGGAKFLRP